MQSFRSRAAASICLKAAKRQSGKASNPMRSTLFAAAVAIGACSSALATGAVSFEGQGYVLDFVVGDNSGPMVAGLSIATPGIARDVVVPLQHLRIDVFDTERKVLLLRFMNPGDSKLPRDFSLAVRGDAGVLLIDGKSIAGRFAWGM